MLTRYVSLTSDDRIGSALIRVFKSGSKQVVPPFLAVCSEIVSTDESAHLYIFLILHCTLSSEKKM